MPAHRGEQWQEQETLTDHLHSKSHIGQRKNRHKIHTGNSGMTPVIKNLKFQTGQVGLMYSFGITYYIDNGVEPVEVEEE